MAFEDDAEEVEDLALLEFAPRQTGVSEGSGRCPGRDWPCAGAG